MNPLMPHILTLLGVPVHSISRDMLRKNIHETLRNHNQKIRGKHITTVNPEFIPFLNLSKDKKVDIELSAGLRLLKDTDALLPTRNESFELPLSRLNTNKKHIKEADGIVWSAW